MHYVIGCGGGGSYLLSILSKTVRPREITIIDGDILEEKNLQRQTTFTYDDVGKKKANILADYYGCESVARYIKEGDGFEVKRSDVIFVCVDNNPARRYALEVADKGGATVFVCGNEYDSAQSYIYKAAWKDNPDKDPRIFFPEILTDNSNDPTEPSCTDQYESTPQLAIFNALSATMAMHLYYLWMKKADVSAKLKTTMFKCNFNKYSQIGGYTPKEEVEE